MIRLVLDLAPAAFAGGGTRTYVEGLAAALGEQSAALGLRVGLSSPPAWMRPDGTKGLRHKLRVAAWQGYYTLLLLPARAARVGADLIHAPAANLPRSRLPVVTTILDVIPLLFPQFYSLRYRLQLGLGLRRSARGAARVVTISEQSRRDIVRLLGIPAERVTVTHLAAAAHFRPLAPGAVAPTLARYGITGPYLLSVCTLEPRKNLVGVLEAFAALRRTRAIPHRLVLGGRRGWLDGPIFAALHRLDIADAVTFTGYLPDADLPALYSGADLFVYAPFYEGFGLPPLEAMACGTPVVTAATSSLPEVVGDAALTVDPADPVALAAAIGQALADPDLAARLRARGLERAARFSWCRCASETAAVYREALAR